MKIRASFIMLFILFIGYSLISCGQDKSERPSPPAKTEGEVDGVKFEINYSQPAVKGRAIWGDLVPFDKIWRTGANEATTITFLSDVKIEGKEVKAGKYALFTIPGKTEWTLILNETWDQWGAYQYDESKDVLRVSVKPGTLEENQERLIFETNKNGFILKWEMLSLPINVTK